MITLFCIHPKGFNVGNDAIHFALRELLHAAFGRVVNVISLPATAHYESQANAGLTAKTIHQINRYGDGVIVGGGNLYENGELLLSTDALEALEPPLMLFSLSRGRIFNRNLQLVQRTDVMPRRSIELLHKKARYSLARDKATYEYLQSIGCTQAVLAGCPTIALGRSVEQLPKLPDAEVAGALISIRTPTLMNLPLRLQARVQGDIARTIEALRARNVGRIRLLCNDVRDVEFATVFQASHSVDYVYTADVRWYLSLLRSAKLVISYRVHATLPCLSFGTPVINLSYDERGLSLLETLGMGAWDIDFPHSPDAASAIQGRFDAMESLSGLRENANPLWDSLCELQLAQMNQFAAEVHDYARQAHAAGRNRPN